MSTPGVPAFGSPVAVSVSASEVYAALFAGVGRDVDQRFPNLHDLAIRCSLDVKADIELVDEVEVVLELFRCGVPECVELLLFVTR